MKPTHIEHIGIAVRSLQTAVPFFEKLLGTPCYAIEEIADQNVRTAFFRVGETKVELLESISPDGPVGRFVEKRGEGLHHIALAVADVGDAVEEVTRMGVRVIDSSPRVGAEGLSIAFLHPASTFGVLTEICGHP